MREMESYRIAWMGFIGSKMKPMLGVMGLSLSFQIATAAEIPSETLLNLGSEKFSVREQAQSELLAWARKFPDQSKDDFYRQSKLTENPEVRERCLSILRELVNEDYLKEGKGYIGIQMRDELANVPNDANVRAVIRVVLVVPGASGERAGLLNNDMIVGLGKDIWRDPGASIVFSEKIKQLRPNDIVKLKVVRDGKLMELDVKLGRRPIFADNPFLDEGFENMEAAESAAKEAYFRQWLERKSAHH